MQKKQTKDTVVQEPAYTIADGKCITSLRGLIASGDTVTPQHFADSKTFTQLLKSGFIIQK